MTIETATYVTQLNPLYPEDLADRSEADDHLRLIKSTVKATFPNIAGAVTVGQAQLNTVVGLTETVVEKLAQYSLSISVEATRVTALSASVVTLYGLEESVLISVSAVTSFTIGGFPAGTSEIRIGLHALKGSATAQVTLALGDSGGIETTGYEGYCTNTAASFAAGFPVAFVPRSASTTLIGTILLRNSDGSGLEWVCEAYTGFPTTAPYLSFAAGSKTLSAALTQVQFSLSVNNFSSFGFVTLSYQRRQP